MRRYFPILILTSLLLLPSACVREQLEPQWQLEGDWAEVQAGNHCSEYIRFRNGYYEKWKSSKTVDMSTGKYRYAYLYMDHRLWGCDAADWTLKERHRYTLADGNVSIEGKTIGTFRFVKDTLQLSSGKVLNYLRLDRYEKTPYTILDLDTYELPVGQPASVQSVGFHISRPVQGWYDTFTYSILSMDADRLTYNITMEEKDFVFRFMDNPSYRPQQSLALLCLAHPFSGTDGEKLIGVSSDTVAVLVTHAGRPVQSLSLDPSELSLKVSGTAQLTATVDPSDADVLWTSDNPSVASVDATGQVKALAAGKAVIKILAGAGDQSASCTVTVGKGTPTFSIAPASLDIASGKKGTITISSNSDCVFTASSSNPSVATVSVSGKTVTVTGVKAGTATVTVNCPATVNYEAASSLTCSVVVYNRMVFDSPANCYIVSNPGAYSFKTVKGNSSTSVGSVSKAEVLWESFGTSTAPSKGDIIKSVSYSGGNITFSTPSTLKNGNAVIAAKDASGNILWSWHIWVCSGYDPVASAQTYYNNAGKMMDRNLGATSATPGDVGALGLLYQWGRKDPFLGSSSISMGTKVASTISWPSPVTSTSSNGTIAYATAHPTTFITYNSSNNDWYYTGSSSTDNTRWQSSKTIYDPCPPGWRVPDGGDSGVWSKAVGSSSSFTRTYDYTKEGMNFSGKFGSAGTIWYPASGYLVYDGSLYSVGGSGYWWSCTPGGYEAYGLYLFSYYPDGEVRPSVSLRRVDGLSVRCLQE